LTDNTPPINLKGAYQLLCRTQNSVGQPEATVITVLVPYNAKPSNLFALSFFTDAAYNGCNPSIALQLGSRLDNLFTSLQTANIVAALDQGCIVSVADDGGPQAAFSSGLQVGQATLSCDGNLLSIRLPAMRSLPSALQMYITNVAHRARIYTMSAILPRF
jgi:hypothetical protein